MKAIVMKEFGGPEVLKYVDVPDPVPEANEVLIKLAFCGVNPNETYVRTGTYNFYKPELPYTPGYDGAGVIEKVGAGVTHVKVGDRVFVAALLAKRNTGTYAQKVVCDADSVHKLPDFISFEEGASFGIPAMAAYRALSHRAHIKAGEIVMIHGAEGGVGSLAVQMAKAVGAIVIGTGTTPEGLDIVRSFGADYAIYHLKADNQDELMELTKGKGPDVIIEFLANVNLQTDLKVIAKYGRIVVVGNRGTIEINPRLAMANESTILGMALWNAPANEYRESLFALRAFMQSGAVRAKVGKQLLLKDAAQAHNEIINGLAKGKMILKIE